MSKASVNKLGSTTAAKAATAKPKKESKPRASKYDEKLKINGSFEDLVKELVTPIKK